MKSKAAVIIGGFTEFIEMYIRTIKDYGEYEIIIIDVEGEKYNDIMNYRKNNKKHFSNIVTQYIKIDKDSEILESLFLNINAIIDNYDIVGIIPVKEMLVVHSA